MPWHGAQKNKKRTKRGEDTRLPKSHVSIGLQAFEGISTNTVWGILSNSPRVSWRITIPVVTLTGQQRFRWFPKWPRILGKALYQRRLRGGYVRRCWIRESECCVIFIREKQSGQPQAPYILCRMKSNGCCSILTTTMRCPQ